MTILRLCFKKCALLKDGTSNLSRLVERQFITAHRRKGSVATWTQSHHH